MSSKGLLQNRINELNSAILNFIDEKVYITGFYNAENLKIHLQKGLQNWSSKGVYDIEEVNFYNTKDDALFIIQKDGKTVDKNQFSKPTKQLVRRKNKTGSVKVHLRKNKFKDQFNLYTEEYSYCFNSKDELIDFLQSEFAEVIEIPE